MSKPYASWQGTDGSWELGPSGWEQKDERLYTIPEAAALKGVSRQAIHAWLMRSGNREQCLRVPSRTTVKPRMWLIPASVLQQYTPDPDPGRSQALIKSWKEKRKNGGS